MAGLPGLWVVLTAGLVAGLYLKAYFHQQRKDNDFKLKLDVVFGIVCAVVGEITLGILFLMGDVAIWVFLLDFPVVLIISIAFVYNAQQYEDLRDRKESDAARKAEDK